jgi:hypothetical protein
MKNDDSSAREGQSGDICITIEHPSMVITKTKAGYDFMKRTDQIVRHMSGCRDLWEVTDVMLHHFSLTTSLLLEIYSFRRKCSELDWDDAAIAAYYAKLAETRSGTTWRTGPFKTQTAQIRVLRAEAQSGF